MKAFPEDEDIIFTQKIDREPDLGPVRRRTIKIDPQGRICDRAVIDAMAAIMGSVIAYEIDAKGVIKPIRGGEGRCGREEALESLNEADSVANPESKSYISEFERRPDDSLHLYRTEPYTITDPSLLERLTKVLVERGRLDPSKGQKLLSYTWFPGGKVRVEIANDDPHAAGDFALTLEASLIKQGAIAQDAYGPESVKIEADGSVELTLTPYGMPDYELLFWNLLVALRRSGYMPGRTITAFNWRLDGVIIPEFAN